MSDKVYGDPSGPVNPEAVLEEALKNAGRGFPVLPVYGIQSGQCACGKRTCGSPGKHPILPGGVKAATTDETTIRSWFSREPVPNIAIAAGRQSGFVALDIDARSGGLESLKRLEKEHGPIPSTPYQATGGGGRHYLFRHPGGEVKNRTGKSALAPGVELKSDGGYILVDPSRHITGGKYQWQLAPDTRFADLPAWVVHALQKEPGRFSDRASPPAGSALLAGTVTAAYGKRALEQECADLAATTEGGRNAKLNGSAYAMGTLVADGLVEAGEVEQALEEAATACGLVKDDGLHQVRATIRSGMRAGINHPRGLRVEERSTQQAPPHDAFEEQPEAPTSAATNGAAVQAATGAGPDRFPMEALPKAVARYAEEAGRSILCAPEIVATCCLPILGGAVGNSSTLRIKHGWEEGCRIWAGIVTPPGAGKSPALRSAARPASQRNTEWAHELKVSHAKSMEEYEEQLALHEAGTLAQKPKKPQHPPRQRLTVRDVTLEALVKIHQENPRGLVVVRDEIAAFFNGMNRYRPGSDRQEYLSLWDGAPLEVDRVKEGGSFFVPRPFINLVGGIQPTMLAVVRESQGEDGMTGRLLWCYPESAWLDGEEGEVSVEAWTEYDALYNALLGLPMPEDRKPREYRLGAEAARLWEEWRKVNRAQVRDGDIDVALREVWAKLPRQLARLTLLLHLCAAAEDAFRSAPDEEVDGDTMRRAIELITYYQHQFRRVLNRMGITDADLKAERVLTWMRDPKRAKKGVVPRDLYVNGVAGIKRASEAKKMLEDLVDRGRAEEKEGRYFVADA